MNTHARRRSRFFAVALTVAALFAASGAATSAPEDPPAAGGDTIEIRLDAGMPVADFLRLASDALGKPVLWSEGDKSIQSRKFTAARSLRVPRAKMLQAVRALLVPHELVVVSIGAEAAETLWVMSAREQMAIMRLKAETVEVNDENVGRLDGQDGWYVAAALPVHHIDSLRDVRQALGRLVTQNNIGQVTEVPAAGMLVVTDFAPNVAAIYRLLKLMDVAPARAGEPTQHFIRLAHRRAYEVAGVLVQQFVLRRPAAPAAQAGAAQAVTAVSDDEPRISADDATSQIVVTCNEAEFAKIRRVVEALDIEPVK